MIFETYATEEEALASFSHRYRTSALPATPGTLAAKNEGLTIYIREIEGVTVLDVSGALVGETAKALPEEVREMLAADKKRLLLNLKGVTNMDSHGVGSLVQAYSGAEKEGAQVRCIFSRTVQQIIRLVFG